MNTPNPLVPQGSLERQSKGKSNVRIAIFTIVSIHAVFFAGLLMQGCRRDENKTALNAADAVTNQNTLPPLDAGYYPGTQEIAHASSSLPSSTASQALVSEQLPTLPPPSELPLDGKVHTVGKGDTLGRIAKANGVTLRALTAANPDVDPSKLQLGQKIQIPVASPATASGASLSYVEPGKSDNAVGTGKIHTVKSGDTLNRIAKQHGLSVRVIRAANNLRSDRLVVGQKLKLPAASASSTAVDSAKTPALSKLTTTNPGHATADR